jgi:acyl-CoA dehydrogenase
MFEWTDEELMVRDAVRRFVADEIKPNLEQLEHGDMPPYDILRKMFRGFGLDAMARESFRRDMDGKRAEPGGGAPDGPGAAFMMIPIIELSRYCPGMVTAMGVSVGLTASAIMRRGTPDQKERWALPLLTLDKIGSWAITEPNSGSDAFGGMLSTARTDGDEFVLNGSKTFITNGPYADVIVFICKLDDGDPPAERRVVSFILDRGMSGLEQSKPLRKMGLHSSPTGQLFLTDVRVGRDRLIGEATGAGRSAAKETFSMERTGVTAMALGIVEQCLQLCVDYSRERVQFGQRIGDFQLIQLKLARMEVARLNIQNQVFRQIEMAQSGRAMSLAEASAAKLYSAQAATEVALEAVQLFGGNGYMAEYQVEQLARDAKVLQIYAGTDEIQVSQIARSLLGEGGGS